jgi:hypothetical protein
MAICYRLRRIIPVLKSVLIPLRRARLVLSEAPQKLWRSCCDGLHRSSDCRDRVPGIASVVLDAAPLLGPTISAIFGLLHFAFGLAFDDDVDDFKRYVPCRRATRLGTFGLDVKGLERPTAS